MLSSKWLFKWTEEDSTRKIFKGGALVYRHMFSIVFCIQFTWKGLHLSLAIGYLSSARIFLAERCEDPGTMEKTYKDGSGSLSG